MVSTIKNFWVEPYFGLTSDCKPQFRVQIRCSSGRGSPVFPSEAGNASFYKKKRNESLVKKGSRLSSSSVWERERNGSFVDKGNRKSGSHVGVEEGVGSLVDTGNVALDCIVGERKTEKDASQESLQNLWDDGYGTQSVKDYLDIAKDMVKPHDAPPRWFCPVECGRPLKDSPVLLFLPGMDGLGLGLILHHKALGKVFEVRCLHIPVYDRTPFEELVKFVERTLRIEHASCPNKPIYLVGDSFGGCLALAVAARNPSIDIVMILANPATSFAQSQLQPFLAVIEALPSELHITVPYLLSNVMGNPMKMAMVNVEKAMPPRAVLEQVSENLVDLLPRLSGLANIIPKETLIWKLKLLKSAAAYTNSRLHAVTAEVLVLASGKDNMLPSRGEAKRLSNALKNCQIRFFEDNGHTILLEDDVNLLTIIKATCKYRRSKRRDFVQNFLPVSMSEFRKAVDENGFFRLLSSPVLFSTMEDGKIVRGLAGVPNEGPVLLVGYHNLLGLELGPLLEQMLKEKNILVRGMAHTILFTKESQPESQEFSFADKLKLFGAVPVSGNNFFRLLANKSHVLLYPGGAREALHYKGEQYKLFWPEEPEFVRMAVKFGATIVPFGAVGEDDVAELVLDYGDQMKIPFLRDYITRSNKGNVNIRTDEFLYFPGVLPKIPGRYYYLFGKPIETKERKDIMKDKQKAVELYLQIKSQVENCLAFLVKKREQDPCRSVFDRIAYRIISAPADIVPSFDP